MSTLKTNTLSNVAGTASTAIENAINGSAKAWVNFNGTGTVAIRASYNVTSITDNGTGSYTVNFTTSMPDANYAMVGHGASSTAATGNTHCALTSSGTGTTPRATGSCTVWVKQAATLVDIELNDVSIFR